MLSEIRITVPAMGPGSWGRLLAKDPWKSQLSKFRAKEDLRIAVERADASKNGASPEVSALIKGHALSTGSAHSTSSDQMDVGREVGRDEGPQPNFAEMRKPGL